MKHPDIQTTKTTKFSKAEIAEMLNKTVDKTVWYVHKPKEK